MDWRVDLQGGSGSESEEVGRKGDGNMELEVTFGGGLDELTHRLQAKKEEATNKRNDSVWQAYERRRRCVFFQWHRVQVHRR
jgi:hypothetical protein